MHTKIITPNNHTNKAIYSNNGSSARAVNYLGKEEIDGEKVFFSDSTLDFYDKEFVTHAIDNNVKGLKEIDDKFDSIIIAPSSIELNHIGSDPEILKHYCRAVMSNYANNFNLSPKPRSTGKPVEFLGSGKAPYMNIKDNKESYYINLKQSNGSLKTIWGVDFEKAVSESDVKVGDKVFIENLGKEKVSVEVERKVNGVPVTETKEVERNKWAILSPAQMADKKAAEAAEKKIPPPELVWFGTIHHNREFSANDAKNSKLVNDLKEQGYTMKEIIDNKQKDAFLKTSNLSITEIENYYQSGVIKPGDPKPGDQRHIHIIVSRRDRDMKTTLNPNTFSRFNKGTFRENNATAFNKLYNYNGKTSTFYEFKEKYITRKIEHLNKKYNLPLGYLEQEKVIDAFRNCKDKEAFIKNFYRFEKKTEKGEFVKDPLKYLVPDAEQHKENFKQTNHSYAAESILSTLKGLSHELDDSKEFIVPINKRRKRRKAEQSREAGHDQSR